MTYEEACELLGPEAVARIQARVDNAPPPTEEQLKILLPLFTPLPRSILAVGTTET
ncbi:hypothetical protein [Pseudonocardia ailaonensis]|uniref:hypothetical protein n=1 Tax=Pseudonocardia ailaonensis TaxID=367279 RepID=UPI0031E0943E